MYYLYIGESGYACEMSRATSHFAGSDNLIPHRNEADWTSSSSIIFERGFFWPRHRGETEHGIVQLVEVNESKSSLARS